MIEDTHREVIINNESDIIVVRKIVREVCESMNFGLTDLTRIVTAASELARNVFLYAGLGMMKWQILCKDNTAGIELTFEDQGPGIDDLEKVMQEGYSTGHGLGLGLPGSRRLMDEMEIRSRIGEGTTVIVRKWMRRY